MTPAILATVDAYSASVMSYATLASLVEYASKTPVHKRCRWTYIPGLHSKRSAASGLRDTRQATTMRSIRQAF